jgi:hypothetical protein
MSWPTARQPCCRPATAVSGAKHVALLPHKAFGERACAKPVKIDGPGRLERAIISLQMKIGCLRTGNRGPGPQAPNRLSTIPSPLATAVLDTISLNLYKAHAFLAGYDGELAPR